MMVPPKSSGTQAFCSVVSWRIHGDTLVVPQGAGGPQEELVHATVRSAFRTTVDDLPPQVRFPTKEMSGLCACSASRRTDECIVT